MAELIEYAQMAAGVYAASSKNKLGTPSGWERTDWQPDRFTGFSAGTYRRGDEVVVAFTGTNDRFADPLNWTAGGGLPVPQIYEAAIYYLEAKAKSPGANITFTGHSLGGGLASLMATLFDRRAVVFDQAPFLLAATSPLVLANLSSLAAWDSSLATYLVTAGILVASREYNVTHYYMEGEILDTVRTIIPSLMGSNRSTPKGASTAGSVELHSMTLLTAALESPNFLSAMQTLPDLVGQMLNGELFFADAKDEAKRDLLRHLLRHQFGANGVTQNAMLDRFGADFGRLAVTAQGTNQDALLRALIEIGLQHYYQQDTTQEYFFTPLSGGIQFDLTQPLGDQDTAVGSILGYEKLLEAARPMAAWEFTGDYPQPWQALNDFTTEGVRWNIALGPHGLNDATSDDTPDLVLGSDQSDSFDAGDGDDLLIGGKGSDNLHGGDGGDKLYGGADEDVLYGDAGDDFLAGGYGNDQLVGSVGKDTYRLQSGGGTDMIIDWAGDSFGGDGVGDIVFDGKSLEGVYKLKGGSSNQWGDTSWTFEYIGQPGDSGLLTIVKAGGGDRVLVPNFRNGDFGITLEAIPQVQTTDLRGTPQPDNTRLTDRQHQADLVATAPNQQLWGEGGADFLILGYEGGIGHGGAGNDILGATAGKQKLLGEEDNDILAAGAGDDSLDGGSGDDALNGGDGNDVLIGGSGRDLLDGGTGMDAIDGGAGNDFILGGGNLTVALYSSGPNSFKRFADGQVAMLSHDAQGKPLLPAVTGVLPDGYSQTAQAFLHVEGDGADVINGGAGDDWVLAGDGDDLVEGGTGKDTLVGDTGDDVVLGGGDDDKLWGDGAIGDVVLTGNNQRFEPNAYDRYHGKDWLDGGDGDDFVSGDGDDDTLYGGEDDDVLVGDSDRVKTDYHGDDFLDGGAGDDELYGYGGDDRLYGGEDDDTLEGDASTVASDQHGNDYLDGGAGDDTLQGDGGNDTLYGGEGDDELHGDAEDVDESAQGDDFLDGEAGDDDLRGYGGNDTLIGGEDDDGLRGDDGNDRLEGGDGDDSLQGDDGNDTLIGGTGSDALEGGEGDDLYVIRSGDGDPDGITDSGGWDTVRLEGAGGLTVSQVNGGDLLIDYGSGRVVVVGGVAGSVEAFEVGGQMFSAAELVGRMATTVLVTVDPDGHPHNLGGKLDDNLAGDGNALLSGGQGDDMIFAAGGANTLLYSTGDGADRVVTGGAGNVLRLGSGIGLDDLKVAGMRAGALTLQVGGNPADTIDFWSFDADDVLGQRPVDRIEFADGSTLDYRDLVGSGFRLTGTAGDDRLTGSNLSDRLAGGDGDDLLAGGRGADWLSGGDGGDTYVFLPDMGADTIVESGGGANVLRFESWLTPDQLHAVREDDNLRILVRGTTDSVVIQGYYAAGAPKDWSVDWGGGNVASLEEVVNHPDDTAKAIDQFWQATRTAIIDAQAQVAASHFNYVPWLGGLVGWTRLGGLNYEIPWATSPAEATFNRQVTITNYRTLEGTLVGVERSESSTGSLSWGMDWAGPTQHRIHYELTRQTGDEAVIVSDRASRATATVLPAIATLDWGGEYYGAQHQEWSEAGVAVDAEGNATHMVYWQYYLDTKRHLALVTNYDWNTQGWTVPANTLVGNRAAVDLRIVDQYELLIAEIIAGASDNEIHADSVATEFVDGGEGDDTIYGGAGAMGRGDVLYGNGGDDNLFGNGSVMAGGDGEDRLTGGDSHDRYLVLAADETGVDLVFDNGGSREGFREWYYGYLGRTDIPAEGDDDGRWILEWDGRIIFDSWTEAESWFECGNMPGWSADGALASGRLTYEPPLPLPLLGDSRDFRLVQVLGGNGILPQDTVELPDGITAADLTFAWGNCDDGGRSRTTLEIGWHGTTHLRIALPRSDDPIGWGVEYVRFADGAMQTMAECLHRAPPMPDLGDGYRMGNREDNRLAASVAGSHLYGLDGSDELIGSQGGDFLDGGQGDDVLAGGAGGDVYVFRDGDGMDRVFDRDATAGNADTVLFAGTAGPADVAVSRSGTDLVLAAATTYNQITLARWFEDESQRIERVAFLDGTVWEVDDLLARLPNLPSLPITATSGDNVMRGTGDSDAMFGLAGDDELHGGAGDDFLRGGPGDDLLAGGSGNDIYWFGVGDGADVILPGTAADGDLDAIHLGAGIGPDDLRLSVSQDGRSLEIRVAGEPDSLLLADWMEEPTAHVMAVEFADGTVWDAADLAAEAEPEAVVRQGTDAGDLLVGAGGEDILHGSGGSDTIEGGPGDDSLVGGAGGDIYLFGPGDGNDWIDDGFDGAPEGTVDHDTIRLGAGFDASQANIEVDDGDIRLTLDSGESITFGIPYEALPTIEFADGTVWTPARVLEAAVNMAGTDADDWLIGTYGDDLIEGRGGDDVLNGCGGSDRLLGGDGADWFNTGGGADWLEGGAGGDYYVLSRQSGNDVVVEAAGGGGRDGIGISGAAPEELGLRRSDADPGDLVISIPAAESSLTIKGWFSETAPARIEYFYWDVSDTYWDAGQIEAAIHAARTEVHLSGNAVFAGGAGDDTLVGSGGGNTYLYARGGGVDRIVDTSRESGTVAPNTLAFGAGIFQDQISLGLGSLLIRIAGENGGAIHVEGFDPEHPFDTPAIDRFSFSDGTVLSLRDLLARGFDLAGSAGNDTITGTATVDRIDGEAGNDLLVGGDGDDRYFFSLGDGNDTVVDSIWGGGNAIDFGPGIGPGDLRFQLEPEGLRVTYGAGDSLLLANYAGMGDPVAAQVRFADGSLGTLPELMNAAPRIGSAIGNPVARRDTPFRFELPFDAFLDEDVFSVTVSLADGDSLPAWLSFDGAVALSGTPALGDVGALELMAVANDPFGATCSQTFTLTVENTNRSPVTAPDTATVTEDGTVFVSGNVLANDSDPDGDSLAVADPGAEETAYGLFGLQAGGDWFYVLDNAAVQSLGAGETLTDVFAYQATDGQETTAGELTVTIAGANDKPVLAAALADRRFGGNTQVSFSVAGSFADADGHDTLTYTARAVGGGQLPAWLSFDAATGTFSGKVPRNAKGSMDIQVTASDGHGAESTASDTFRLSFGKSGGGCHGNEGVGNGNDPPPPGHDHDHNDGAGTGPGHPGHGHHSGRDAIEDLARRFAEGHIDVAAMALALERFDAACQDRRRREERDWRDDERGAGPRDAWTRMHRRLDEHLARWDGGVLGDELSGRHDRASDFSCLTPGDGRHVLAGHRQTVGVQAFQSLQGLQEGLGRLG